VNPMIAVVLSRDGVLPIGGEEALAECGGHGIVIHIDGLHPAALAASLTERLSDSSVVVLPASPDGRDLAPRLAAAMGRPLLAGATAVWPGGATLARQGGLVIERHEVIGPFVATLIPGSRGVPAGLDVPDAIELPVDGDSADPRVIEVSTPDASELDLAEARHILAVGAGLGHPGFVDLASEITDSLGMSLGSTRVVTDWGWLPFERQIGTTGATVDPSVYVALAISGAVQHVTGLGDPDHIASINTDGSCPMSTMAEANIVSDARAVLVALADRLDISVDPALRGIVGVAPRDSVGVANGGNQS